MYPLSPFLKNILFYGDKKKGHEDDIVSEYYAGRYRARGNDDIVGVVRYIE